MKVRRIKAGSSPPQTLDWRGGRVLAPGVEFTLTIGRGRALKDTCPQRLQSKCLNEKFFVYGFRIFGYDGREVIKMQQEEFYTVDEVAKMLRVSDRTIRKHIEKGLLRALSVGKVYRITRTDLEDYFERIKTRRTDSQ